MYLTTLRALALIISIANAFKDTSPFFAFSTSEILASSPQIISAASLSKQIFGGLKTCPSDTYVVVTQPGVNVADYSNQLSTPHLRKRISGNHKDVRSSQAVAEVLGDVNADGIIEMLQETCGAGLLRIDASTGSFAIADDMKPRVIDLEFPALPTGSGRATKLSEYDAFLASVLDLLPSTRYTVIYTTSSASTQQHTLVDQTELYEMDAMFASPAHMELKRDFSYHKRNTSEPNVDLPNGPLFEKYQFFTPGLFMGILITLPLLSILYVGISGVASLQVSYAAFDKEMGPVAQKQQS